MNRFPLELRLWLLAFLLSLPFIGRSYFVDDHYQLLMARGLLEHPARPYDFRADDAGPGNAGWERGRPPRMVNPPLHPYMAAALLWASGDPSLGPTPGHPGGGDRIWVVRLGMSAFACLSVPLLCLLARRCLVPPGPAGLLAAVTPAFWLSSTALLIDSTLLTFFLGSLVAWIEGLKRRLPLLLALAGILMGATLLTKYTGGFVVILAGLYWLLEGDAEGRRRPWPLLFLLIPAAVLAGWNAWTAALYGAPHLTASAARVMQSFSLIHVLAFLSFFGGVLLFPLESWAWAWRRPVRGGVAAAAAAVLAGFLVSRFGGFSPVQAVSLSLLFSGAALFFIRVFSSRPDGRVPTDLFLALWLAVASVQMIAVMQWVAARYYLTLLPPAVLLLLRLWAREAPHAPRALSRRAAAWGAALFLFTGGLAVADYVQAGVGRRIVRDLARDGRVPGAGRRCFYAGDSFSGSLLGYAGWEALFPSTVLKPGDWVLYHQVVMPAWWFRPAGVSVVASYAYPSRWPLRLMDNQGTAGFYASAWGALPWTFSRGPLERYLLLEVSSEKK